MTRPTPEALVEAALAAALVGTPELLFEEPRATVWNRVTDPEHPRFPHRIGMANDIVEAYDEAVELELYGAEDVLVMLRGDAALAALTFLAARVVAAQEQLAEVTAERDALAGRVEKLRAGLKAISNGAYFDPHWRPSDLQSRVLVALAADDADGGKL